MFRNNLRPHLAVYFVMDLQEIQGRSALETARAALEGGITMLQLREKKAPIPQVLEQGRAIRGLCREYGVPFVVNDRVDLALLLDADGIHVGQDDIPGRLVRKLVGEQMFIGISASSPEEARVAMTEGADYLGVGAIYATRTKGDAGAPIGTSLIESIRSERPDMPMVGIGGIDRTNLEPVIRSGADGVAVVSAIAAQADPKQAAAELREAVRRAAG
ncbi:thiamine phosphate synthase [Paenibacillus filicis]|uniref:Thiamine-phosphate synthase n=1 Tax=Paenibacillus gyeongsangnamensis TaxID=3388067 RepID=A0ABT4Q3B6_9BACL|nr:thiamine phosphate synthase [Paenibacillus filicis]MCZ8511373.1 thiamine phosphate synthase [Paenibacillus filicis]